MSLARALTKRMRSHEDVAEDGNAPSRSYSTRQFNKPIDRNKISLPLELISSSNALAYEAPDIHLMQESPPAPMIASPTSSASSTKSYTDSLTSPGVSSASSITSQELSRESSPAIKSPGKKTFLFDESPKASTAPALEEPKSAPMQSASTETPSVPQRAPSHTKKTHEVVARARSQRLSSPPPSVKLTAPGTRSSVDMFSSKPEANHPFGAELAKVNELAEEFGMKEVQVVDEETQYLVDHGLLHFSVDDYLCEIQPLYSIAFPAQTAWL